MPQAASLTSISEQIPAIQPTWTRDLSPLTELKRSVENVQRYFRDQGIPSSPLVRPVIAGKVVLVRSLQELQAFDRNSGEPLWSVPNLENSWIAKRPGSLENNPFRNAIASVWHRRLEADSIFGAIGTDGTMVVVVHEPDRSNVEFPASIPTSRTGPTGVVSSRWNRLGSYDAGTGQLKWQIGGPATGPADLLGGISFQGAPLFVDDLLFVVSRRDDELSLMAIDRETGHLRWSISLGVLAPHLAEATSRRRIACPVTLAHGRLICPTVSGMLVAVDPITRTLEWATRYPLLQHDLPARPTNANVMPTLPDAWWSEWREVKCLPVGRGASRSVSNAVAPANLVIVASPDSDQLQAFDVADGTSRWQVPRAGAIQLVGAWQDQVIVAEATAIRLHDVQTGKVVWRANTGEISGSAILAGNYLLQPRRAGGLAILNLAEKTRQPFLHDSGTAYGNLVPSDDGWISQVDQTLQGFSSLRAVRKRVEERASVQANEATALDIARLDLHAGDPFAAYRRLAGIESADARNLRRDVLLAAMRLHNSGAMPPQPFDRMSLGKELLDACESYDDQLLALRALGDAARFDGDHVAALTHYLNGLDVVHTVGLRSTGDWPADPISTRPVRIDRIFLGSIQRLLDDPALSRDAAIRVRADLDHLLAERLASARRADDPFAVQRLIDRLLPLEWSQRTLLENTPAAFYARSLQKSEPQLLAIAGSRDPFIAARALEVYADLLIQSGWREQSESVQRRILIEHPGIPLSNGQTLAAILAATPELNETRQRLMGPPAESWSPRLPTVERTSKRRDDDHEVPVHIRHLPGSLLDHMDVTVDSRQARRLRFSAQGHEGTWDFRIPGTPKALRTQFAQLDQLEAFAIGRMLVLRIGSEVLGIHPFNERGEPGASSTLLQMDIAPTTVESPNESWWQPEVTVGKPGIRRDGVRLVNGFGQTFSGLGAVRSRYLCYQTQAKLIAVDTQTGRRVWERLDVPTNCQVMGDDDHVYVWSTDDRLMRVLSAIDGEELRRHAWNVSPDDVLMHQDRFQWSVLREPATTVEMRDASDGKILWSQSFAPNATPFVMDSHHLGVIEPNGLLQILAAYSGGSVGEAMTIAVPERIDRIVATGDAQRWYVSVSGPVPRLPNLQAEHVWGAFRTPFINGWMYGIDRRTGTISWRRFLDCESVPFMASRVVPVMVQSWRRPSLEGGNGNDSQGILRMIDTRSGREILTFRDLNLRPYFSIVPSEKRETIEIATEKELFVLKYAPRDSQEK